MTAVGDRRAIAAGVGRANAVRAEWLDNLQQGKVTLPTLIQVARRARNGDPENALKKLKCIDLLTPNDSWSPATAADALWHNQIDPDSAILKHFRNREILHTIVELSEQGSGQWTEVHFPEGWPWNGRLRDVFSGRGLKELDTIDMSDAALIAADQERAQSIEELTPSRTGDHLDDAYLVPSNALIDSEQDEADDNFDDFDDSDEDDDDDFGDFE